MEYIMAKRVFTKFPLILQDFIRLTVPFLSKNNKNGVQTMSSLIKFVSLVALVVVFILPGTAHAYIDPGTGSIILQALAAGLLGLGVFWRRIMACIKPLFGRDEK